jgi:DNA-binding NarL/FixJ family response regulator
MTHRVLLADDSELVRRAIRRFLSDQPAIELIGEALNFSQAVALINELHPDVVVLDLHMADSRSISAANFVAQIEAVNPRIIAISVWSDEESAALAKSFGACTLLDKINLGTQLLPAILESTSS